MLDPEACAKLWQSHRDGTDPTAYDRVFAALHRDVFTSLRAQFSATPAADIEDAVVDAFVALIMQPDTFNPKISSLLSFLKMIGSRRLIDHNRAANRHPLDSLDTLSMTTDSKVSTSDTSQVEFEAIDRIVFEGRDPKESLRPEVDMWLEALLPLTHERNLFLLTLDEDLAVEEFAALFNLQALPLAEQRSEMKRARDRIQKRVQRDGPRLWQIIFGDAMPPRLPGKKSAAGRKP